MRASMTLCAQAQRRTCLWCENCCRATAVQGPALPMDAKKTRRATHSSSAASAASAPQPHPVEDQDWVGAESHQPHDSDEEAHR